MTLKELVNSISKKEWRWVILLSIVMILILGLPYVYAYLNSQPGYFYTGLHSFTPGDYPVYFSYINQIKAGHWQLRDYFTSEAQPRGAGLINFFWLAVGLLARLFYLPADFAFHLSRLLLIPVFFIIFYIFTAYFFTAKNQRKLTVLFITFSSGIGTYFAGYLLKFPSGTDDLIYKWPLDLWIPELNVFSVLSHSSHIIFSFILLVAFMLLMLLAWDNNNYWYSLAAGLCGFVWFNFHPFFFPYVAIILFLYLLYLIGKTKRIKLSGHYLLAMALSLPFIFYHYYKIKTDLVIGARASQNILPTPPFLFVFLGFGFLLIFSIIAIIYLAPKKILFKNNKHVFLAIWLVAALAIIYAPIFFQRRFLMGMQIPMVFLIIILLANWAASHPNSKILANKFLLVMLFVIFFCFSTFFNLVRDVYYFHEHIPQFYLPKEFKTGLNWLNDNNGEKKIILSYEITGQFIPGFINQQVYLAHGIETINYKEKRNEVSKFFADKFTEPEAKEFLKANRIGYVFFTNVERKYCQIKPADKDYLQPVFSDGQVEIYAVKN
ncbi:MAG: hypothetical protein NTX00_02340 [Candidatus Parcubacteria bacterium]|nr:hypothetical protein [Candidatus Parcubacteria bacterium]